jgi:hypothetical protein
MIQTTKCASSKHKRTIDRKRERESGNRDQRRELESFMEGAGQARERERSKR